MSLLITLMSCKSTPGTIEKLPAPPHSPNLQWINGNNDLRCLTTKEALDLYIYLQELKGYFRRLKVRYGFEE